MAYTKKADSETEFEVDELESGFKKIDVTRLNNISLMYDINNFYIDPKTHFIKSKFRVKVDGIDHQMLPEDEHDSL